MQRLHLKLYLPITSLKDRLRHVHILNELHLISLKLNAGRIQLREIYYQSKRIKVRADDRCDNERRSAPEVLHAREMLFLRSVTLAPKEGQRKRIFDLVIRLG